ncbi:ATP-binding protein [Nocardioides sp. URHA0032]|uniref:ATP-binding protein n=1 Tax=Nocardioides sp. URHA0032 TaxID=1380388 RepID=UPI000491485C|nr:ATP-binding protein [Nocardioides sp. URHA0032]
MNHWPIRVRLVAGFSVAMLVVLIASAVFVYWRVEYALDRGLDGDLQRATAALAQSVGADGSVADDDAVTATGAVYQVLDSRGEVIAHSPSAGAEPIVEPDGVDHAETVDVGRLLPISDRPLRAEVTPTVVDGKPAYLVVAVRREHRDEALRELLLQLGIGVFGSLLVASVVGYVLTRQALLPVERYRRQAEEIAAGATGVRLDVPDTRDDEVVRLGNTLNDMLTALERALESERHFVDDASHELRTPLTVLKSRVQSAQRRTRTVEEHEDILGELLVDVERLTRLAEQLLELRPELTDDVLDRITANLVANAHLHGRAPVKVDLTRMGDWQVLTVEDDGPGMDAEMLDRATDRFARADDARSRPGSGLGLAIVRSLTDSAGGQLRLCCRGEHRRFGTHVDLPCRHDPDKMTASVFLPAGQ